MKSPMVKAELSLVIPAYNEAVLLPRLLDSVDLARARYKRGPGALEVIVANNASTDRTADLAAERGCRVVLVEKRVIAAVRNGGARAATGRIIGFVDADSRIHPDTFNEIDRIMADPRVIGGATSVLPERWSAGILMTYLMFLSLALVTRMDTGVVFCRRDAFDEVGGYEERRHYAEDIAFLWSLRRAGARRGQRLTRITRVKALTSMRKFDRHGDWHYFTRMLRLGVLMFTEPDRSDAFARRYWYDRES